MINSVPPTLNSIHGREKCFKHNNFSITIFSCHLVQWSQIWLHLLNFRKERVWIPVKTYRISSNNSRPSINRPSLMEIFEIMTSLQQLPPPPPPTLSPSSLSFIPSLSSWREILSSKTNQWWFKLWKLIKEPNLEHLKSPCSVYLMW